MIPIPSEVCAALVIHFEGFRSRAYRCPAGLWTIGYGSTQIRDGGVLRPVREGDLLDKMTAGALMRDHLEDECWQTLIRTIQGMSFAQCEVDALCSFIYNVGVATWRTSGVRKNLMLSNPAEAMDVLQQYRKGGGKILPGLVRRRAAERAVFEGKPLADALALADGIKEV